MYDDVNKGLLDFAKFEDFARDHLRIRAKSNMLSNLVFNKEQLFIQNAIEQQKKSLSKVRCVILKGRQIGATTFISARGYYLLNTNRGYKIFVLAHRRSATNNIFDIVHRYYINTPAHLQQKASIQKHKGLSLIENDSSYSFATAGSNEVARSETIQFFHGSEVAFWKNSDNHLASVLMAVPEGCNSEVILESTSNGPSGAFYELCMDAKAKKNDYQLIFLPWHWHSQYVLEDNSIVLSKAWLDYGKRYGLSEQQLKWAYLKNKMLNISGNNNEDGPCIRFYQEFPADIAEAFKFSKSNNLINLEDILNCSYDKNFCKVNGNTMDDTINNSIDNAKFVIENTFNSQYLLPNVAIKNKFLAEQKHRDIIFGLDVATGGGDLTWLIDRQGDFLGFNVNEARNFESTMDIVGWLVEKIKQFSPKAVCIDAGGGGIGVVDRLIELGYKDIVIQVYFGAKASNSRKFMNKRAEMWCALKDFIEGNKHIIHDSVLIHQISEVEYGYNSNGQIQLEAKDKLKARLKSSPDGGDAAALTFATDVMPKLEYNIKYVEDKSLNSFNPFEW